MITPRVLRRLAAAAFAWAQWLGMAVMAGLLVGLLTGCGGGDEDAADGDTTQAVAAVCLQKPGYQGWPAQHATCTTKGAR